MRRFITKTTIGLAAICGLAFLGGCEVHEEPPPSAPPPAAVVYVSPGYYYDEEYIDVYGVHHPRVYYYWDGHNWDHRDRVPEGYVVHARAHQEHHEEHAEHHQDEHHY